MRPTGARSTAESAAEVWLVGMTGSGKTFLGRRAATRLGVAFFDSDGLVEVQARKTIAQIWSDEGEEAFRARESEVLRSLEAETGIRSTGGGAVLAEHNRKLLAEAPIVVWLRAGPRTLAERVGGVEDRPLLSGGSPSRILGGLLDARRDLYKSVATHQVDTDVLDADSATDRLVDIWNGP